MSWVGWGPRLTLVASLAALAVTTGVQPVSAQAPSPPVDSAGQASVVTLGADTELLRDGFDGPSSWGLGETDTVTISFGGGGLRIRQEGGGGGSNWTWRDSVAARPVVRVGVDTTFERGTGEAGPMCVSEANPPSFYLGIATTRDDWVVARIVDSDIEVIARGPLPGPAPSEGTRTRIEIECAVTGGAGDRIALFVDGTNVADVTDGRSIGPFDRPGVYAGIYGQSFQALFDDLVMSGGEAYAPATSLEGPGESPSPPPQPTPLPAGTLMAAVPASFRADCRTVPPDTASGQLEAVLCVPAGAVDAAEYYRYATLDALDAAFARFIPSGAALSGTSCADGPSTADFTVNGRVAGTLACYGDPRGGVTFQWANRDLLVLAFGTTRAGTYADADAWWQTAGPIP